MGFTSPLWTLLMSLLKPPGWGAEQIQTFQPGWITLRSYEVPKNRFYASSDRAMFATPAQREWFESNYTEQVRFGEGELGLVVMRKRSAPTPCTQDSRS